MPKINPLHALDEDFEYSPGHYGEFKKNPRFKQEVRSEHAILDEMLQHINVEVGADAVFTPTLNSSRHEREWILSYLGPFYEEEQITDVLRRVKGGKEANVYCCAAPPESDEPYIAAKLYRPRMFRNLRNDLRYRQNRDILDEYGKKVRDVRMLRAIRKGTGIGKEATHTSWLEHEYKTLELLHAAGVKVPRPIAHDNNTILMEYFGDLDEPAPTLHEVRLSKTEARQLFLTLMEHVEKMLVCKRVHGDLSAFNVLYYEGDFRIIDLPQAVLPDQNPEAFDIFRRDVIRLCQYFNRYGLDADGPRLARQIWARCGLRENSFVERAAEDILLNADADE